MNIKKLLSISTDKGNFKTLYNFIEFTLKYLDFISNNLQARIVSQNETQYQFFQYSKEGHFNITRPINTELMYDLASFETNVKIFQEILSSLPSDSPHPQAHRMIFNRAVYTIQQSIGASLDALSSKETNQARKIHGDLFERFVRILFRSIDISCVSGIINVPIKDSEERKLFDTKYQHDLIITKDEKTKIIGSVKTSSKDRIDKVFMDKFMYWKLTDTYIPHIAVFLNDVQRKKTSKPNQYGVSSTFLPGHFKAYALKLTPLDGVYYCDIRPNMIDDPFLASQISTLDRLFFNDVWVFLSAENPGAEGIKIKPRD
ncbi:MAG: hypothetical protein LHW56_01965 [Candidatus Cloacimonetes bacterium]|nr:hypothetical protein [Candidatus Cloacimonadota bacterium]MDY0171652.1 hypothetical protein [Candidatus Cloacimonadaceae bacterium]